jgi:hypothetical protein
MSDLGTMIARINDELALPMVAARIPNAIQAAIRYYESERLWFNEGESTASTVASQQAYAMPTDFLEPDVLTITYTTDNIRFTLKRRPWSWMRLHQIDPDTTSRPRDWSYYADQIWLYPIPDQVYTLTMSHLKRLAALSAFADTNEWMTHGEELIRTRAEWDLLFHTAKNYKAAEALERAVEKALSNLRGKSSQKISTGKLSFDDGLMTSRGNYQILYQ